MARHGTNSGWVEHIRKGERPCDPCYYARSEYDKRRRSAPEQVQQSRFLALAQRKAYSELAHRHPDEYQALYEQWKARLAGERAS